MEENNTINPANFTNNTNSTNQGLTNKKTSAVLVFFLILFLLITGYLFLKNNKKNKDLPKEITKNVINSTTNTNPTETLKKEEKNTKDSLSLKVLEGERVSLGSLITLEISADLKEAADIVGYDIILSYDSNNFELINSQSLLTDFDLMRTKGENYLALTGYKKLTSNTKTVLVNQKIINLTFKPKNKGIFTFTILLTKNKLKTKLVDDKTQVYYPKTDSIKVEIY
ncbi:MAG: hypothetical protein N2482_03245 [Patescibacteria group bacterium]|nr:hypothetical protein [Patescibacteria group bacterium]